MFDKDFYPTPEEVFMMMGVECTNKVVLEPQAGKGNIVEFLKNSGAKTVLCCENNKDLAEIVKRKAQFLTYDFFDLTPEMISHVDMIVMNPPFSNDVKHILHAYDIAPNGTEIISLCNYSNIQNSWTGNEKRMERLICDFGSSAELGNVFTDAERKTGVNVGIVKLYKPGVREDQFSEFFTTEEDDPFGSEESGLMSYNEVRAVVQVYVQAIKDFKEYSAMTKKMQSNLSSVGIREVFKVEVTYNQTIRDAVDFAKEIQKHCWKHVFKKLNVEKYLSKGVKEDLARFIQENEKFPFTMKNIYNMISALIQTRGQTLERSLVEVIGYFTQYTHENRFMLEGWKTNSGYMINEKFIINYVLQTSYSTRSYVKIDNSGAQMERLEDLVKILCVLTSKNYDEVLDFGYATCTLPYLYEGYGKVLKDTKTSPYDRPHDYNKFEANKWYSHEFFEFKVFKKGTMHLKFKNRKHWELLNREYARIKGQVLPEKI